MLSKMSDSLSQFISLALFIVLSICFCSTLALPCEWITKSEQKLDPHISGWPKVVTLGQGQGLEGCKNECVKESTFICAAVSYQSSNRRCELLEENDQTAEPLSDPDYQYSLRPICAGFWQPWTSEKGSFLKIGVNNSTDTFNLRNCMSRCLDNVGSKKCRSINKATSNSSCVFIDKRSDDANAISEVSLDWQFFNRPHWYLDEAPGATGMTVSQRDDRLDDYVIMYNNPIAADGYLVAWQYFTRSSDTPCPTYAVVWEQYGTSRNFRLIDQTLLHSQQQGLGAVNFNYIADKIVKVKQGECPSLIVRREGNCSGNLVTFRNGGTQAYFGDHQDVRNLNVYDNLTVSTDRSFHYSDNYAGRRTVSIRPFVAEYLVVARIYADLSNMAENSVQLSWGEPVGYKSREAGKQNITGGGFKVTCSTSAVFNSEVACSGRPSVFLDTERSAILYLPNYTLPFYARVQVVRNFNGLEIVDEKYASSQKFCAGRPMLTDNQVIIEETGVLVPGVYRTVSLQTHSLIDSCVDTVRISFESGSLHGEGNSGPWSFTKGQGVNFTITMSTNLVGGYQQQVLTRFYQTKKVPEAPNGLRATARTTNSALLEWSLIEGYNDAIITYYQVICSLTNSTFNQDAFSQSSQALVFTTSAGDDSNLELTSLLPQVQYECQVKALLGNEGYGFSSSLLSLWTKPEYPVLNTSSNLETTVYDSNVTITLPDVTAFNNFDLRFSMIWIVVQQSSTQHRERSTTTTTLSIDGTSTYIAAKLALEDSTSTFVVGDGQMYWGFKNRELWSESFTIYVGYQAVTEQEVTEFYQLNQESLRVVLPSNSTPIPSSGGTTIKGAAGTVGGIAGGVVGVVVVALIVLSFIYLRRRLSRQNDAVDNIYQHTGQAMLDLHIYDIPEDNQHCGNACQLEDRSLPDSHACHALPGQHDTTYQNLLSTSPEMPVNDDYEQPC